MNPITHALVGWCAAEAVGGLRRRESALVTIAGVIPDADGLGILPELLTRHSKNPVLWWTDYHHVLFHNLATAVVTGILAALLAKSRRMTTGLLAFIAVHLHLLGDLAGSRGPDGYQWPIPYLSPFSPREWSWSGQWALNAWQNIAITIALLVITFVLAWKRGYSPLELISRRADAAFVGALRARFAR
jgi:inner membrane protein